MGCKMVVIEPSIQSTKEMTCLTFNKDNKEEKLLFFHTFIIFNLKLKSQTEISKIFTVEKLIFLLIRVSGRTFCLFKLKLINFSIKMYFYDKKN